MVAKVAARSEFFEFAERCGFWGAMVGGFAGLGVGGLDGAERTVSILDKQGMDNKTIRGVLAIGGGILGGGIGAFGGCVIGGAVGICTPLTAPIGASALAMHTVYTRWLGD